ncbi:MAG: hypothetical protein A2133_07375 [Actinobacteria bacterium RBG_16_64_13]|nr:MAG: hypothetical protein A2133_07375 [Actinobacteria bacterium RBG_16_64_13]
MAHFTASTASAPPGLYGPPAARRPHFAARRRIFVAVALLMVLGIAAAANYGPLQAYRDARSRLEEAREAVTSLEAQKTELQGELGRLNEAGYLESLAREQLTYARPGEDLYIIDGSESTTTGPTEAAPPGTADRPGLLERMLSALGGLF